jgi:hypothetical protein
MLGIEAINRIEEIQKKETDDLRWFAEHPDREFRLRRAYDCEHLERPPPGWNVFAIIHRQEITEYWKHHFFGERRNFNTERSDAEIRELLT